MDVEGRIELKGSKEEERYVPTEIFTYRLQNLELLQLCLLKEKSILPGEDFLTCI